MMNKKVHTTKVDLQSEPPLDTYKEPQYAGVPIPRDIPRGKAKVFLIVILLIFILLTLISL